MNSVCYKYRNLMCVVVVVCVLLMHVCIPLEGALQLVTMAAIAIVQVAAGHCSNK